MAAKTPSFLDYFKIMQFKINLKPLILAPDLKFYYRIHPAFPLLLKSVHMANHEFLFCRVKVLALAIIFPFVFVFVH